MATQRPVNLGSLAPGLNNRLEPTRLSTRLADRSQATFLYGAENVDITADGYIKRRLGKTVTDGSVAAHSLWADARGGYVVAGDELRQFNGTVGALVRSGVPRGRISYSRGADGDVYWSNGFDIRRIAAGVDRPIATPPPQDPAPSDITISTGGSLTAGKYIIAWTSITADGESPATTPVQVEVDDGASILLPGAFHVYMTGPNGDILTYQGLSASVLSHVENSRRLETLNTALMPAGTIVRHFNGRMLVANGPSLYVSNPYNYGIYDPSSGYFPFPENISVIEPTDNGIYICADKTYWINDLFSDTLQEMLPYGGIPGTSGRTPDSTKVFWQSPRGLVVADKNASVKNVQEENVEMSAASFGASIYRERDGMHQVISTRFGVEPSVAVATSFMDAEVIRKGTVL